MVQFENLLESSSCTTDAEIVGLALWYLQKYEEAGYVAYDDVGDVLRSSGVLLSSQKSSGVVTDHTRFVIEPLRALRRRGLVKQNHAGDKLTEDGVDHIESKIDKPLPDENAPNNRFLEIDCDGFRELAVKEINLCYNASAYAATIVMTRRLIEDLLIDINRSHFGDNSIDKYYIPESGRHKRLGELIEIFENNLEEFSNYSTAIDKSSHNFIQELDSFVNTANSQAHSINIHISKEEMVERSSTATRLVKILLDIRMNARSE